MRTVTDKTIHVLNFINYFQEENGYSPSIPQIAEGANINSIRGVTLQLDKLQEFGYIERKKHSRRAIKILTKPEQINSSESTKIPLVGEIKAGYNALAQENIEGYYDVPLSLLHGRKDLFLLRVRGESMLNAGFCPGDLVIVAPQPTAFNGDIVVAYDPDDETATLKRFKKIDGFILLLPESNNPTYQPKIGRQFQIQGKVIDKFVPTSSLS